MDDQGKLKGMKIKYSELFHCDENLCVSSGIELTFNRNLNQAIVFVKIFSQIFLKFLQVI